MTTCIGNSPPPQRLKKLLARALDPACRDGEAETSAVLAVRHARREQMDLGRFAEAIAPSRRLPPPPDNKPTVPAACEIRMSCGKHIGRSLGWIGRNDSDYLVWLAEGFSNPFIRAAARRVIEHFGMGEQ